MECSTSYGSYSSNTLHPANAYLLLTTRAKLLRKERRASKLLKRAVVRAVSGEPTLPVPWDQQHIPIFCMVLEGCAQ